MKLKRIISLIISVCLMSMMAFGYAANDSDGRYNGDKGGNTEVKNGGKYPVFSGYDQGYRAYLVSGTANDNNLQVVSPVIDLLFADVPNGTVGFTKTTIEKVNVTKIDSYYNQYSHYKGQMPRPLEYDGNEFVSQGYKLREWLLTDLKVINNKKYKNLDEFVAVNFPDQYNIFKSQQARLIVESIAWFTPRDANKNSPGYMIYGTVRELVDYVHNTLGYTDGAYSGWFTNEALPHSIVLLCEDNNVGYIAPTGDQLSGIQSDDTILNSNIGFGMHIYWSLGDNDELSPSPTPPTPDDSGDLGGDDTGEVIIPSPSQQPLTPIEPVGPEPGGGENVITTIAKASYIKSENYNLNLDSTQWSLSKRATSGDDGWQGINQVLPGGAIYSLTTDNTYIKLETWESYLDGGENAAAYYNKKFLSQAKEALDNWQIVQYVDDNAKASNAFSGIQVESGGQSLSALGLSNKTSSDSKYYLRDGTTSNKANENDLDIVSSGTQEIDYTIISDVDDDGSVIIEITKNINGRSSSISESSAEAKLIDTYTNAITKARIEAPLTIYVTHSVSTIYVGFSNPSVRSSALDPNLCPKKTGTSDYYTNAFISQFRLAPESTIYNNRTDGYIGTFKDEDVCLSAATSLFKSKPFYIPNANVQDTD